MSSAVMLTAGFLLSSASAWAEDTSIDEVTITVPSSCTMTGTLNTAHTTSLLSGETANNIGTTTLKVICNDSAGYAIYAIGYTDDVYGKTVLTSSALGSSYDIATATTVTTGTSSWAMKLATSGSSYLPVIVGSTGDSEKVSSTPDFSNYVAVPTQYTRVAYRNSATDVGTGALGSSLTTTYRVYVSPVQPAGTYIGQVKYTLVHPSTALTPENCEPDGTTISTILCMQDISSSNKSTILASMIEGQLYTLKDIRDDEDYYVAKMPDGNIWMLDNLRLDLSKALPNYDGEDNVVLTSGNTNASEHAISCLLTGSYGGSTCSGSYAPNALVVKTSNDQYFVQGNHDRPSAINRGSCSSSVCPMTQFLGNGIRIA